jgi:hypothetical protein
MARFEFDAAARWARFDPRKTLARRTVATRQVNHSTIAIQELMHTVGVLDPVDPRTPVAVAEIRGHIRSMRPHR